MQSVEWRPFARLLGIRGGLSLRCDGGMSWEGQPLETTIANRRVYFTRNGLDPLSAVAAEQTHGCRVAVVERGDAGAGIVSPDTRVPATDALVTADSGIVLTTLHADCAPIFYWDPVRRVIALAHAGWRGTLTGIAGRVVQTMTREFGCVPADLHVEIGPTISMSRYDVDDDLAQKFTSTFSEDVCSRRNGRSQLDLVGALQLDLAWHGVRITSGSVRPPCTASNSYYASYRRDGSPVGCMLAWLTMSAD